MNAPDLPDTHVSEMVIRIYSHGGRQVSVGMADRGPLQLSTQEKAAVLRTAADQLERGEGTYGRGER